MSGSHELADWVRREMTVERGDILSRSKERVSKILGITPQGQVEFRISADGLSRLNARDKVLLYALGKLYANVAGYAADEAVSSIEFVTGLGIPRGTVDRTLKELRESHQLNAVREGVHSLPTNRVPEVLTEIEGRIA